MRIVVCGGAGFIGSTFVRMCVREHGDEVLALLAGLRTAAERGELPVPAAPTRDPGRRRREEALKEFRAEKATERGVTPSVVLPNPLVEQLAATHPAD